VKYLLGKKTSESYFFAAHCTATFGFYLIDLLFLSYSKFGVPKRETLGIATAVIFSVQMPFLSRDQSTKGKMADKDNSV